MTTLLAFTLALVNVPRKVGSRAWRRCFWLAMQHGSLVGINESFTPAQWTSYRRLSKRAGWGHSDLTASPNPIFWNRKVWRLKRERVKRLHGPARGRLARKWPGYNAARYATIVVLTHLATGRRVVVINTHLAAYGPKVSNAWRAWAIARSVTILAAIIARHLLAGRVVVLMGDTNSQTLRIPAPRFRWVWGKGIDKAGVGLPKGAALVEQAAGRFAAPTDHQHGVRADLTIIFKE